MSLNFSTRQAEVEWSDALRGWQVCFDAAANFIQRDVRKLKSLQLLKQMLFVIMLLAVDMRCDSYLRTQVSLWVPFS